MNKWEVHKEDGRWVAKVGAVGYTFPDHPTAFRFAEMQALADTFKVS